MTGLLKRIGWMVLLFGMLAPVWADYEKGASAYERGDYATALRKFQRQAAKGDPKAQYKLGEMYLKGQGTEKDFKEAAKWLRQAAEQGYAPAQSNLGVMYGKGRGVLQDDKEAVKWLRQAAEQGYAPAQSNLGVMYKWGQGTERNLIQAYMWFDLAAKQGDQKAEINRARLAEEMTTTQIAEAQRLAREWKPSQVKK
ncbi:MAG: tetratricopeptide repeat protein [Candidatus Competibacteraceae bacterium]